MSTLILHAEIYALYVLCYCYCYRDFEFANKNLRQMNFVACASTWSFRRYIYLRCSPIDTW